MTVEYIIFLKRNHRLFIIWIIIVKNIYYWFVAIRIFNGNITDDDFIYYLENCKKYEIDINNAIRKKEVNINKYGIKAVRLMYDGDYLKEMIKEYIAGNSMFK